jgi:hypothetical protein
MYCGHVKVVMDLHVLTSSECEEVVGMLSVYICIDMNLVSD